METYSASAEDWRLLTTFFPEAWKRLAESSGALKGLRQDKSAEDCLRVIMLHVGCGFSLRETVARAREAGIANLSDVALLKRLRKSRQWLHELCRELLTERGFSPSRTDNRPLRLIDATVVKEPGKTGSLWRIHYSFRWPTLECDWLKVTATQGDEVSESIKQHPIQSGDLLLADRGYCRAGEIHYAHARKAFVTIRLNTQSVRLETRDGHRFPLMAKLQTLKKPGQVAQWDAWIPFENQPPLKVRLCVIRKSHAATLRSERKLKRHASKDGSRLQPETLFYARYVMVLTTFPQAEFPAAKVLETYRFRWQVELIFKRLKQIAQLGHLPKYDDESSKAWLYGKLFVALLTEKLIGHADALSPWGYTLETLPQSLA